MQWCIPQRVSEPEHSEKVVHAGDGGAAAVVPCRLRRKSAQKGPGTGKLEHERGAEGASVSRQPRESDWNLNTVRRAAHRAQLAAERWYPR